MSENPTPEKLADAPAGAAYPKGTHLVRELKHDRGKLACRFDPAGR